MPRQRPGLLNSTRNAYRAMQTVQKRMAGPSWSQFNAYEIKQILNAKKRFNKQGNPTYRYKYPYKTSRRYVINAVDDDVTTRSLLFMNPLSIPKATAAFELNTRTRDIIDLSAVKVTFRALTNASSPEEGGALQYRMVIVQQKNSDSVSTSDFFRGDGSNDRGFDFSVALNSMEFHNLPLNTDVYEILAERKGILQPYDKWCRDETVYIPLKRRIHYDSSGSPILPIRVFYWFDVPNAIGGDTGLTSANWKRMVRCETFFHNVD